MKLKMVEKGWEYRTEDDKVVVKKSYRRMAVTNTGHSTLNRYADVAVWTVSGLKDNTLLQFKTLNEAKAFVEKELSRELGRLREEYSLLDTSEENLKRGERIKEICKELNLASNPRKNRTPCIYRPR